MKRGMYVDDADFYVKKFSKYQQTGFSIFLQEIDQLKTFISTRHISYIALYNLEAGTDYYPATVLQSISAMKALSGLIGYLKSGIPDLEVGVVISLKKIKEFKKALMAAYNYNAGPLFPLFPGTGCELTIKPKWFQLFNLPDLPADSLLNNEFELNFLFSNSKKNQLI
ncbi:MAG: hypothetical protein NZM15_07690 [Flavobacteriales bacterium]|nr:hypothetical protein [Flavobacteriales bacterium]MDW8432568.1 hypothetical protein [Flavobacteriales bacterium]